jgi:hypothetical protein
MDLARIAVRQSGRSPWTSERDVAIEFGLWEMISSRMEISHPSGKGNMFCFREDVDLPKGARLFPQWMRLSVLSSFQEMTQSDHRTRLT